MDRMGIGYREREWGRDVDGCRKGKGTQGFESNREKG